MWIFDHEPQQLVDASACLQDKIGHRSKEEVGHLREQLEAKDQQLEAKDKQIAELIRMANREQKRRNKGSITKKRSEPEKRRIAMRQNWTCVNPDGSCPLRGDLREYEVDHRAPARLSVAQTPMTTCRLCARPVTGRRPTVRTKSGAVVGAATSDHPA